MDGEILHKNAHDKGFRESRGEVLITRGMHVFSASMGVSGECDVLEFHRDETGIPLKDREGLWRPYVSVLFAWCSVGIYKAGSADWQSPRYASFNIWF